MREVGSYRILETIGQGTTGIVFKAEHVTGKHQVALKVLRPGLGRNPDYAANFIRECRFAQSVDHTHLVKIHDSGESQGCLYMVREFVPGMDYAQMIHDQGAQSEPHVLTLASEVCTAFQSLSQAGLVVRVLSPHNIMFWPDGAARVCGIGLGRMTPSAVTLARPSVPHGRVAFMAPEQIRGGRDIDARAGIYSLGVTMFNALTGTNPFAGRSTQETLSKILFEPTPDPRQYAPKISDAIRDIVLKSISRNRDDRFSGPADMLQTLSSLKRAVAFAPAPPKADPKNLDGTVKTRSLSIFSLNKPAPPAPSPVSAGAQAQPAGKPHYFRGRLVQ